MFQAEGMVSAKTLGQKCAWYVQEVLRRPAWLELSEQGESPR